MRHLGPVAALLTVGMAAVLPASSSEAQQFYTGSGTNMFRVFGCAPNTTLNVSGTGWTQQGECTIYPGSVVAAVPIEAWVSTQISGLHAQNEKLQRQVDELLAPVRALEAAASSGPGSSGPRSQPSAAPK
jgi:hypothetical protein